LQIEEYRQIAHAELACPISGLLELFSIQAPFNAGKEKFFLLLCLHTMEFLPPQDMRRRMHLLDDAAMKAASHWFSTRKHLPCRKSLNELCSLNRRDAAEPNAQRLIFDAIIERARRASFAD
jgi:hypothetical protein